jgi:hypothetical protein
VVQRLYFNPLDGNRSWGLPAPSEVHHQLLGLADFELEGVLLRPSDEALRHTAVLVLPFLNDAAYDGGVIRELLKVAFQS